CQASESMKDRPYIHGTSRREQERLIHQAELLSELLAGNLEYQAGERVLEIGCGVGAVLGQIGKAHPDARLHGIDISPEQIEAAREHLSGLGLDRVELRVGDGAALPWESGTMDRVRLVWVVEHLRNPLAVLREALRVLRPGGTIHITETDYASLRVSPPDAAIEAMLQAFIAHFNRHGNAHAGPALGPLLEQAGFLQVSNQMVGIHHWCPSQRAEVQEFCDYLLRFIEPEGAALIHAAATAAAARQITTGLERFAALATRPDGAISLTGYQARGMKDPEDRPS
ncbi:methyltransferase domain-containing protein, partial [Vulcanococcus sp.]|uniref:methyltransferase domain-containing protein n=1 Tax=Vulcanococcus sp. TaxID=2856995 RepID=UPI003BFAACE4